MSPRKPWYRARNIILTLLGLAIAWLGIETYRALTATPGSSVDYAAQLNQLVASHQPKGAANGWGDWMVALETLSNQLTLAHEQFGDDPLRSGYGWPYDFQAITDPNLPEDIRRQTLDVMDKLKAAGLHDQLAHAAAADAAYRVLPTSDRLIEVLLPELGQFRSLARYQAGRMRLAAAAGDWDDFALAFDQTIRSAHVLSHQGVLIDHLVGYAIQSLALNELNAALEQHDPPAVTLQRLARPSIAPHPATSNWPSALSTSPHSTPSSGPTPTTAAATADSFSPKPTWRCHWAVEPLRPACQAERSSTSSPSSCPPRSRPRARRTSSSCAPSSGRT